MNIEMMGFGDQFNLKDAYDLLNCHVVKIELKDKKNHDISEIGFVAGIITLNDEIEVMIKFSQELLQLNKTDFYNKISLLEMA